MQICTWPGSLAVRYRNNDASFGRLSVLAVCAFARAAAGMAGTRAERDHDARPDYAIAPLLH